VVAELGWGGKEGVGGGGGEEGREGGMWGYERYGNGGKSVEG